MVTIYCGRLYVFGFGTPRQGKEGFHRSTDRSTDRPTDLRRTCGVDFCFDIERTSDVDAFGYVGKYEV